jgi:hypothetical protein
MQTSASASASASLVSKIAARAVPALQREVGRGGVREAEDGHFVASFFVDIPSLCTTYICDGDVARAIEAKMQSLELYDCVAARVVVLEPHCCAVFPLCWWCICVRTVLVHVAWCNPL